MISIAHIQQTGINMQLLFPTPVGFFDLGREFTKQETEFIVRLEQKQNEGNTRSVNSYVLNAPELYGLKLFISESIDKYFQEIYRPLMDVKLRITQSWTNNTNKNEHHHKHKHSNSFVSGVLYIQTTENDKITFYKPHDGALKFPPKEYTMLNAESWWFSVTQGMLILFPSNLDHMVEIKNTEGMRISLAFNTFPIGVIGDQTALNELILGESYGK